MAGANHQAGKTPETVPRFYQTLRPLAFALPPEAAHRLAFSAFRLAALAAQGVKDDPVLKTRVAGLVFSNPVGMAAGFDKDAEIPETLAKAGFGFVEVGTLTPLPQAGNPKPRLFRLVPDRALINRLGFNNRGFDAALARLRRIPKPRRTGILGINIGANRDTKDPVRDYVKGVETFYSHADYLTLNISSPNTPGLRDLQTGKPLGALLAAVSRQRKKFAGKRKISAPPVFLKVAPDLEKKQVQAVVREALNHKIDGLVISNTTASRPKGLQSPNRDEDGGLSGKPLFDLSTRVLKQAHQQSRGQLALIGVGGVSSGAEAYAKILAGASLVQFYTALVYHGPGAVLEIRRELAERLRKDGFNSVAEAVGKGA